MNAFGRLFERVLLLTLSALWHVGILYLLWRIAVALERTSSEPAGVANAIEG